MRSVKSFRPLLALAALLLGVTAACAPRSLPPQGTQTPVPSTQPKADIDTSRPVKVALLVPVKSSDQEAASLARSIADAARIAETESGAGAIQLMVYETSGDVTSVRTAAERAVSEGAGLILGPLFSASTRAVAPVAVRTGLKIISFSTDSAVAGDPVYLSGFMPEAETARILDYAARQGINSVAVYYPDSRFGDAALNGARKAAAATTMALVASASYPRSFEGIQGTAEGFAEAALGAGAESILLPEGGQGLQTVAAFTSYYGISPGEVKYLGLGQWNSSATFGDPALQGGWFPAPDPQAVQAFLWRYETNYGARPNMLAVLGYDAVKVAIELVRDARVSGRADPFDREALTRPQGFRGALGPLRFRTDGYGERALAILEVGTGTFSIVEQAPLSFGPGT